MTGIIDNRITLDDMYAWPQNQFYMKKILSSREPGPLLFNALFSADELMHLTPVRESVNELTFLSVSTAKQLQDMTNFMIRKWSANGRRRLPFIAADLSKLVADVENMMDSLPFAIFGNCRTLVNYFMWQLQVLQKNEIPVQILTCPPHLWFIGWGQLHEPDALLRLQIASYLCNYRVNVDLAISQTMYRVVAFAADILLYSLLESFTFQRPLYLHSAPYVPPVVYSSPAPYHNVYTNGAQAYEPWIPDAAHQNRPHPASIASSSSSSSRSVDGPPPNIPMNNVQPAVQNDQSSSTSFATSSRSVAGAVIVEGTEGSGQTGSKPAAPTVAVRDDSTETDSAVTEHSLGPASYCKQTSVVEPCASVPEQPAINKRQTVLGQKRKGSVEIDGPLVKKEKLGDSPLTQRIMKIKQELAEEEEADTQAAAPTPTPLPPPAPASAPAPVKDTKILIPLKLENKESAEVQLVWKANNNLNASQFSSTVDPWSKSTCAMQQDEDLTFYYKLWFIDLIELNKRTRQEAGLTLRDYIKIDDCYFATDSPVPDEWTKSVRQMMLDQDLTCYYKLWFKQLIGEIRQMRSRMLAPVSS